MVIRLDLSIYWLNATDVALLGGRYRAVTKTEFLLGLNRKYLDRKCLKQDLRYQAPEVIQSIIVSSDQVLALVDMLVELDILKKD
jgi:hypothetical protein